MTQTSHAAPPRAPQPPAAATGPKQVTRRDRSNPVDQPPVSALLKLRFKWIVAGVILGAVVGLVASLVLGVGRFSAQTVLQVAPTSDDSQRAAQLAQSVKVMAGSTPVLEVASEKTGVPVSQLRQRALVTWDDGTDIVTVQVSARTSEGAKEQSTAIADAVIELSGANTDARLSALTEQAQKLVTEAPLPDETAETQRKAGLGYTLAQQQGAAIGAGADIEVINPADSAEPSGITPLLGVLLGAFAGLALAAAAALLLPIGRHRLRDNREVGVLAPTLRLRSRRAAHEQAGRLMESGGSTLAVLAMPGAEDSGRQFADRVVRVLGAHGLAAQLVDARSGMTAEQAMILRRADRGIDGDRVRVLLCPASEDTIELLAGQTEVLSAIVMLPRRTRLDDLQDVASAVATSRPAAVIWS